MKNQRTARVIWRTINTMREEWAFSYDYYRRDRYSIKIISSKLIGSNHWVWIVSQYYTTNLRLSVFVKTIYSFRHLLSPFLLDAVCQLFFFSCHAERFSTDKKNSKSSWKKISNVYSINSQRTSLPCSGFYFVFFFTTSHRRQWCYFCGNTYK